MAEPALILCVDDNEGTRYAIVRTLQRHGFRTLAAGSGADTLAQMKERPDLVVLDVQLPDMSGYEVCQRIKADPSTSGTPVLQISADFVDVEHRTRGLEMGADAYLAHPIEPPELIATIRSLLRARRAEEEARRTALQLESTFDAISDGICLLDAAGRIVRCNQGLGRLFGRKPEELVGQPHDVLGLPQDEDPFRRMAESHAREVVNARIGERWLLVTSDPVRSDRGELTGAVYVFTDVTQSRQAAEERERLLQREQAAHSEAQAALAALRATETRFRRLAEANLFGVFEADLVGQVTAGNDIYLRMIGRSREELERGEVRWDEITAPEGREADARAVRQLRERGSCDPYETEYVRRDGTRVCVFLGAAMIEGRDEALVFVLDVTPIKRLEGELRGKVLELETADQRKDEFLAMLAHELRNPLAAITTGMHLLSDVQPSGEQAHRVRTTVLRQVGMLTRLVDDLLDVSRITRGKVELRRERLPLREAVSNAIATSRPLLDERRHALEVQLPDEPLFVIADGTRLEQVVANLINNAAKYTEAGGRISLSLQRDRGEAVVRVRDTGIGISPEHLPHVFELFKQVDQSPARTRGGLGVGLTLVRRLIEMHGGSVRASSAGLGKGSEFEVRLPLAADQEVAQPAKVAEPAHGRAHHHLLLIEDNPDIGETLRELLQLLGHRVDWVSDGVRGVQAAIASRPEVALVDIGLPGIDGYEVARRLRASERGSDFLLVALTGYGRPEDRARALEAGFNAHLTKPVEPDELMKLIARLTGQRDAPVVTVKP